MSKKSIKLTFPEGKVSFLAELMFDEEPEMCSLLWKNLEKPVKYFCHHTLSSGQVFLGYPRPPKKRLKTGLQSKPIGRNILKTTQMSPGMIQYTGLFFRMSYGQNLTEPVQCAGPVIANVKEEEMDNIKKAGELVWRREALEHKMTTFIVERKENK